MSKIVKYCDGSGETRDKGAVLLRLLEKADDVLLYDQESDLELDIEVIKEKPPDMILVHLGPETGWSEYKIPEVVRKFESISNLFNNIDHVCHTVFISDGLSFQQDAINCWTGIGKVSAYDFNEIFEIEPVAPATFGDALFAKAGKLKLNNYVKKVHNLRHEIIEPFLPLFWRISDYIRKSENKTKPESAFEGIDDKYVSTFQTRCVKACKAIETLENIYMDSEYLDNDQKEQIKIHLQDFQSFFTDKLVPFMEKFNENRNEYVTIAEINQLWLIRNKNLKDIVDRSDR